MTRNRLLAGSSVVTAALVLASCAAAQPPAGTDEDAERPARVETLWTDAHEWFVEHPLFVVGEEAEIAAHLTGLDDFRAIITGSLDVALLDASGAARQSVTADAVARPGIFLPVVTPATAGEGRLRLVYTSPEGRVDEVSWAVRVAATPDDLGDAPAEPEGIGFLKEQQWRIPFGTVATAPVSLRPSIELPATIETHPRGTAMMAAPAGGRFVAPESGLVTPGATVRKGQVLGLLTALPESRDGWNALPAELVEAGNRVTEAERELARAERLVEAGAVAARRLHEAQVEVENASARMAVVEARAAAAGDEADGRVALSLRAPMAGVVAEVRVTDGEPVGPERTLFRIVDLRRLVARVEVPEPELQRLLTAQRAGETPALTLRPAAGEATAASGRWIVGDRLLDLGVEVDADSRTAPMRYELLDAADRLRPGMSTVARLQLGAEREALAIPAEAVIELAGIEVVYVQLGGETFEERVVTTGLRQGDLVEIASGLSVGERVVTTGAYKVRLAALSPDAAPAHSH